jgi:hypothetical protein
LSGGGDQPEFDEGGAQVDAQQQGLHCARLHVPLALAVWAR